MAYNFRARKTALWIVDHVPRIGDHAVTKTQRAELDARVTDAFQRARRQVAEATGLPMATHPFEILSRRTLLEEHLDGVVIEESADDLEGVFPPALSSRPGRWVGGHVLGGIAAAAAILKPDSGGVERVYRGRHHLRTIFTAERLAGMSRDKTQLGVGPEVEYHLLDVAAEESVIANVPWLIHDRSVQYGEDKLRLAPIPGSGEGNAAKFLMGYRAMARFWALESAARDEPLLRPTLPYPTTDRGRKFLTRIKLGDEAPGSVARALSAEWVDTVAATMADRTFPVDAMTSPEQLPTAQEWRDPKAWITRVGGSGGRRNR